MTAMAITPEYVTTLQNLRAASAVTTHKDRWAQVLIFEDGATVLICGDSSEPGPKGVKEVLYGTDEKAMAPLRQSTFQDLVKRYGSV